MRTVDLALVEVARAVDTGFAVGAVVAVQRLEHCRAPGPVHHRRCAALERVKHGRIGIAHLSRRTEQPPRQRDRRGVGNDRMQRRQCMIAAVDVDEFVNIERQDPVGLFNDAVFARDLECRELDAALVIRAVVAHMGQPAQTCKIIQHGIGAIVAII